MQRILLVVACILAAAMPALSQTLRISLRQDLDVRGSNPDHQLCRAHRSPGEPCDKLFDIDEKLNIRAPTRHRI